MNRFLIALATALAAASALADSRPSVPLLPKYRQECAACHMAYPPGALPAASWQRIMANLPRHYGTDASLDPATVRELSGWLSSHAGTWKRVDTPPRDDRITQAPWFVREHREVSAATWKLPAVKSAAHCAACHTQADQGDFRERNIRIPR